MNSHQTIVDAIVAATGFTNDQSALHAELLLNAVMNRLGRAQEIDSIDHEELSDDWIFKATVTDDDQEIVVTHWIKKPVAE